jgi:predicted DNA-binding protein
MSDMASGRLTIRIPETLGQRLRRRSRMNGQPESALIREALETYLGRSAELRPAFELAEEAGLIGCVGRGRKAPPKDLSTALRHFDGFGKSKPTRNTKAPAISRGWVLDTAREATTE